MIIEKIKIPVERDGEKVGVIQFDPQDVNFIERFYDLIEKLEAKETEILEKEKELDADDSVDAYGIPKNMRARIALVKDLCTFMKAQVDDVFGEGTSDIAFGGANNPAMFEQFFDEITPLIQTARTEKMEAYMNRAQRRASKGKKVMK
ncbi:MAG: hypothetical protein PHW03_07280 [Eubacteriales bacterium]|nr:hypothetical protein [Eubacteriales bacterium]